VQGLIPESTLFEIQSKVDIVELISSYIPLRSAGRNYKAVCPFHSEKTPSFMVNPEKQIFHCFGCGAGGNVFGFVMRHENVNFPEAAEMLAQRAGVIIPEKSGERSDINKKQLFETTEKVCQYFEKCFLKNEDAKEAREYLRSRGLNLKAVQLFRLGYCSANESQVLQDLLKMGLEESLLDKIGLLTLREQSRGVKFKGRVMFPILDVQGRIAGFGGRSLGERQPKYLNSPETVLFNKSQLLYGLHLAKKPILDSSQVIVVEGYMDVISVYMNGVENVVASLGTAFNESHERLLRRYTQEVVVSYDGDAAGLEASLRALEVFLTQDMIVKIAKMPEGHDPDSWIRKAGRDGFLELIKHAPSMMDFKLEILRKRYQGQTEKDKLMITREMNQTIGRLKNPILQDHYLQLLSKELGVSETALREQMGRETQSFRPKTMAKEVQEGGQGKKNQISRDREEEFLRIILWHNELLENARQLLVPEDLDNEICKQLYQKILDKKSDSVMTEGSLELQELMGKLLAENLISSEMSLDDRLRKIVNHLKIDSYRRNRRVLENQLLDYEKTGKKTEELNVILSKINVIDKEIDLRKKM
jgi:DNA primase